MAKVLRHTPLNAVHRALGARMAPFAGWDMPVQYAGILEEAAAVRGQAGIFDVSHMGRFHLRGAGAAATLERVASNAMADLAPGRGRYSLVTNGDGGIVDDIIVYRLEDRSYLAVVNAVNATKDWEWIRTHAAPDTTMEDTTTGTAAIAVQGPAAVALTADLYGAALLDAPRFSITVQSGPHGPRSFCRTGYTGEDGYEIILPACEAEAAWQRLMDGGATACGLGARDVLRTEAGYPLYGHEIDDDTSPVDTGMMWAVKLEGRNFVGRDAVAEQKARGARMALVGLMVTGRVVPRHGYTLYHCQEAVGRVTSGVFSRERACGVGLAYVTAEHRVEGTELEMEVRGARHAATVVSRRNLLFHTRPD